MEGEFKFQTVRLDESQRLGTGSYGTVCLAECDGLQCAAKILHREMFESNDPGAPMLRQRFEQECRLLAAIKHPHIVQYLGTYQHPESRHQVLLMELMDESLTHFLERSVTPLPYYLQVNICHDVVLALVYLHANNVIHRDLSSNNVLLNAGCRAKVTDFGMSRLAEACPRLSVPLTQCPGCAAYMAPEALRTPPAYTEKLDTFSMGVLIMQIITRVFPDPEPPFRPINDSKYPTGVVQEQVPDVERRRGVIAQIDSDHPLRPVALDCINFNDKMRPSAQELRTHIAALKAFSHYTESLQKMPQSVNVVARVLKSDSEFDESLQGKLDVAQKQVGRLQDALEQQQQENQELRQELSDQAEQIADLEKQVQAMQNSPEGIDHSLSWRAIDSAPCKMYRGATAVEGSLIYVNPSSTTQVLQCNTETLEWSSLPDCSHTDFGLAIVNGLLTTVGGDLSSSKPTNVLLTLLRGHRWSTHFPPMPTKRLEPAVACADHLLVVAGGKIELLGKLSTVEVMNTTTCQWFTAASLPVPVSGMSITVAGENVYLLGGFDERGASLSAFTCTISALRHSLRSRSFRIRFLKRSRSHRNTWRTIADTPAYYSSCVSLDGHVMAVGGVNSTQQPVSTVHVYNPNTDSWKAISHMPTARYDCFVSVLPDSKVIVVGGCTSSNWSSWTDVVEIGT